MAFLAKGGRATVKTKTAKEMVRFRYYRQDSIETASSVVVISRRATRESLHVFREKDNVGVVVVGASVLTKVEEEKKIRFQSEGIFFSWRRMSLSERKLESKK